MFHYWFAVLGTLIGRFFRSPLAIDETLTRRYRVRLADCDGLRVMAAFRYPAYMDLIRWELIARSALFKAIVRRGLAPTLGAQKLIYRHPIKCWSRFELTLSVLGWDDKWVYHQHLFSQQGEVRALGITRCLVWRRDVPHVLQEVRQEAGGTEPMRPPPAWVQAMFADDKERLEACAAALADDGEAPRSPGH